MSVLLPFVATEFYRRLVEGIEGVLLEQRYDLALFPILSLARLKRYLENTTLAYLTDGLILASYDLTERFEEGRLPTERPVVLVDAQNPATTPSTWTTAWGKARRGLPRPLPGAHLRHRRGGGARPGLPPHGLRRTDGGLPGGPEGGRPPLLPRPALHHPPLPGGGRLALRHFLEKASPPLNVFAGADQVALGVLEEAVRLGLTPGRDVRVLGFDGHPFAEEAGLSTIAQPVEAMGARAAQLLLERMRGYQGPPREVRFEPVLVERASTGTPPAALYVP